MAADAPRHRLQSVELDEESLASVSRDQDQERQIAIFDLLEDNHFAPDGAQGGPYDLKIALIDNRLAWTSRGRPISAGTFFRFRPCARWCVTIEWSARATTKPFATPRPSGSKPWIWAGAASTTKAQA